jgi:hypothetical protein
MDQLEKILILLKKSLKRFIRKVQKTCFMPLQIKMTKKHSKISMSFGNLKLANLILQWYLSHKNHQSIKILEQVRNQLMVQIIRVVIK